MARDSQRSKVYKADDALNAFTRGEPLDSIDDIKRYIIRVCKRDRLLAEFPFLRTISNDILSGKLHVHDGGGTTIARGGYNYLNFPRWARRDATVLHELAHVIHKREPYMGDRQWQTARSEDEGYQQDHGWRFVHILSRLALHVLGREAHDAFKAACKKERVRMRPKKKLSPERLAQLRLQGQQLAAARRQATSGT